MSVSSEYYKLLKIKLLKGTIVGMIIIWAKLSDIFGRKTLAILALFLFTVFSGACGASQTMDQLHV